MGEKVIVEEDQSIIDIIDKNIESEDVSEEIVISVVGLGGEESGSCEGAEFKWGLFSAFWHFVIFWFPLKYGDDNDELEGDSETEDEDADKLSEEIEKDIFQLLLL